MATRHPHNPPYPTRMDVLHGDAPPVQRGIRNNPRLEGLNLRGAGLTATETRDVARAVAARGVEYPDTLGAVNLVDLAAPGACAAALRGLRTVDSLRSLTVRQDEEADPLVDDEVLLSSDGSCTVADDDGPVAIPRNLRFLCFGSISMSAPGMDWLARCVLNHATPLGLALDGCDVLDAGWRAFARVASDAAAPSSSAPSAQPPPAFPIQELRLVATSLAHIDQVLQHCSALERLSIQSSEINGSRAKVLVRALLRHPRLTELRLQRCAIRDEGCAALADLLSEGTAIRILDLSRNKIGDAGAASLSARLADNTTVHDLDLSRNRLGDEGLAELGGGVAANSTLANLVIGGNRATSDGLRAFRRIAASRRYAGLACDDDSDGILSDATGDNFLGFNYRDSDLED